MAILEAWAYRLPVLMTPQCNLPEGFAAGAAFQMQPEAEEIKEALYKLLKMSRTGREQMGGYGFDLVRNRFSWHAIANEMAGVYHWVLGQGELPDCVRLD